VTASTMSLKLLNLPIILNARNARIILSFARSVCACVCACVRACVHGCVGAWVRA